MALRIAIVGFGKIAHDQHLPVLTAHPGFEVAAVVSRNATTAGAPITADFDFLQTGPQTWDIRVETDAGRLVLSKGGSELFIDGERRDTAPEAEYRGLYGRFARLVAAGESDVDVTPLRHVADAFLCGERRIVEPFVE